MDYESTRQSQYASDVNLTLPTAAMRTGDFSATGTTIIYDPLTGNSDGTGRTPFPGNIVPSSRIASASATLDGPSAGADQAEPIPDQLRRLTVTPLTPWIAGIGRCNYNPNEKVMTWGRYSISPMDIVGAACPR